MGLVKMAGRWLFRCQRTASRLMTYGFLHWSSSRLQLHHLQSLHSDVAKCSLEGMYGRSLVCDFQGTLHRSPSLFPYFMLVAFEGGSPLRALLLLLACPVLWVLGVHSEASLRVMAFITFCGLRTKDMDLVARAVLPKFYLEGIHLQAYEVLASAGKKTVITDMPRLMLEVFLKEYLGGAIDMVGAELQVVKGCYFTGLMTGSSLASKLKALKDLCGEANKVDVALVSPSSPHGSLFLAHSQEAYLVSDITSQGTVMPRDKYPKPLVFHDGRLTFLPTPSAALSLFLWLPFGILVFTIRLVLGLLLPYEASFVMAAVTGIRVTADGLGNADDSTRCRGALYVCTHRTLLDPIALSAVVRRSVPAVTYSLSSLTEALSPIRTVRLTRDRVRDADTIRRLLGEGDLAVCPEGTTCREPYLLRFSSLFAELTDEMIPVALKARTGMFYPTTANGRKWLDPVLFLMDPLPQYRVEILERVPREETCGAGWSPADVANRIQRRLGDALGFQCTALTRRDKYMILAGNDGTVN